MTPLESAIWDRILGFCLDHGEAAFSFAARLAQDNGWELLYALRVLDEYRKFAFLLAAAGHMVVPSDAVDQAWHLHILYTKSWVANKAAAIGVALVLLIGVTRVIIGITRDKPVGFLVQDTSASSGGGAGGGGGGDGGGGGGGS
jgi:hypothetical protein